MLATRFTDTDQAEALARRALGAAQDMDDAKLVRRCQLSLFEALTVADRTEEALAPGESCMAWIGSLDDDERQRNFHGAMAVLYDNVGQPAKCRAQNEPAREIVERRRLRQPSEPCRESRDQRE